MNDRSGSRLMMLFAGSLSFALGSSRFLERAAGTAKRLHRCVGRMSMFHVQGTLSERTDLGSISKESEDEEDVVSGCWCCCGC